MSSSYVARHVFERVHEKLPGYVIKFTAERPRNPDNQAGPEESRRLEFFRQHPELTRWSGKIQLNGKADLAMSARCGPTSRAFAATASETLPPRWLPTTGPKRGLAARSERSPGWTRWPCR